MGVLVKALCLCFKQEKVVSITLFENSMETPNVCTKAVLEDQISTLEDENQSLWSKKVNGVALAVTVKEIFRGVENIEDCS